MTFQPEALATLSRPASVSVLMPDVRSAEVPPNRKIELPRFLSSGTRLPTSSNAPVFSVASSNESPTYRSLNSPTLGAEGFTVTVVIVGAAFVRATATACCRTTRRPTTRPAQSAAMVTSRSTHTHLNCVALILPEASGLDLGLCGLCVIVVPAIHWVVCRAMLLGSPTLAQQDGRV